MTGFNRTLRVLATVAAVASVGTLMGAGCLFPVPPAEPLAANAGADTTVVAGSTVALSGSATGGTGVYTFQWQQQSGPTLVMNPAAGNAASISLSAPSTSAGGAAVFQLTVTDSGGSVASDTVTVTVTVPTPPISTLAVTATATPSSITIPPSPQTVVLSATPTGGTGVYSSFSWLQTAGTPLLITDSTSQNASVSVAVAGTYTFTVTVVDSGGASKTSAPVSVTATGTPPPATLDFTLNCDDLPGTAGDDVFSAPAEFTSGVPTGFVSTLQSCDQANGGGGNDVLNATLNDVAPPATLSPTLTAIQTINLNVQGAVAPFNAVNTTGATLFASVGSTFPATIINIPSIVDAAMTNVITTGANMTMAYANASILGSSTDAMTLTVSGTAATIAPSPAWVLAAPGVLETLNVVSDGSTTNKLGAIATPVGMATLNISGAAALEVEGAIVGAAATGITIAAGSDTGGVKLNAPAGVAVNFTGGAGNDTIRFAAADFDASDKVNGGAGTNTLGIADLALNPPAAGLKSAINAVTNCTILELTGAGFNLDIDQVTPFTQFLISGGGANNIINTATANTFTYNANAAAQTIAKKNALQNTLNVAVDGTTNPVAGTIVTLASLTSDQTTVNLTSNGTNGNTVTALGSALNATTNILGSKDLVIGGMTFAGTVAAGSFSGKLTVTGSAGNDAITGSPQADKIRGVGGVDAMSGGGGADIFYWGAPAEAPAAVFGSTDLVNDFATGTDKLSLNAAAGAFNLVGGNTLAAANVATGGFAPTKNVVSITTAATTLATADAVTAIGNATANYAVGDQVLFIVHSATDTAAFLFVSAAADATVTAAELGNPIISILGVTNVNATTDVTLTAVFP